MSEIEVLFRPPPGRKELESPKSSSGKLSAKYRQNAFAFAVVGIQVVPYLILAILVWFGGAPSTNWWDGLLGLIGKLIATAALLVGAGLALVPWGSIVAGPVLMLIAFFARQESVAAAIIGTGFYLVMAGVHLIAAIVMTILSAIELRAEAASQPSSVLDLSSAKRRVWGSAGAHVAGGGFGDRGAIGAAGERELAAALTQMAERLPQARLFHGLCFTPGKKGADIDHAVLVGNRLLLLDAKRWLAGSYRWVSGGSVERMCQGEEFFGSFEGGDVHMADALAMWKALLPAVDVLAAVVVVPSSTEFGLETPRLEVDNGGHPRGLTLHTLDELDDLLEWVSRGGEYVDRIVMKTLVENIQSVEREDLYRDPSTGITPGQHPVTHELVLDPRTVHSLLELADSALSSPDAAKTITFYRKSSTHIALALQLGDVVAELSGVGKWRGARDPFALDFTTFSDSLRRGGSVEFKVRDDVALINDESVTARRLGEVTVQASEGPPLHSRVTLDLKAWAEASTPQAELPGMPRERRPAFMTITPRVATQQSISIAPVLPVGSANYARSVAASGHTAWDSETWTVNSLDLHRTTQMLKAQSMGLTMWADEQTISLAGNDGQCTFTLKKLRGV